MTDSFLHNHQAALDSQRENDAIRDLEDAGIYPDPGDYPDNDAVMEAFNEDSLKWDSIPDDDKKEWEDAFYGVPDKEDLAE